MDELFRIIADIPPLAKVLSSLAALGLTGWVSARVANAKAKKADSDAAKHKTEVVSEVVQQKTLKAEKEDKDSRAQMWQNDVVKLRARIEELETKLLEVQARYAEKLKAQIDASDIHEESLRKKYKTEIQELHVEIDELRKRIQDWTVKYQQLQFSNNDLTAQLEKLLAEKDRLNKQIEIYKASIEQLKTELDEAIGGYFLRVRSENFRRDAVPKMSIDESREVLTIENDSYPDAEYIESVFDPLFSLISSFFVRHNTLKVCFNVPFLNTVSTRYFRQLLEMLEIYMIEHKKTIKIVWMYEADDEDCREKGEQLQHFLTKIKIEFQSYTK